MSRPTDLGEAFLIRPACPSSEYSEDFLRGMVNRMSVSYHKYGLVRESSGIDAVATAKRCLDKYLDTGNTEYLIDGANYCQIEFMRPVHPQAYFAATDSEGSPGRVLTTGQTITEAIRNEDL